MNIVQVSSRAIRIESQGGSITLPYRLYWNGHDRDPESIVLEDTRVQAFFLFATVKDEISENGHGIRIDRSWSVMTPGTLRLTINVDFTSGDATFLFPGVSAVEAARPVSFLGERTSLPSAVFVFDGAGARHGAGSAAAASGRFGGSSLAASAGRPGGSSPAAQLGGSGGVLLFTGFPAGDEDAASIGVKKVHHDDGSLLSVEVRIPPLEEPRGVTGPRPGNSVEPEVTDIESAGGLSRRHTLYAVFAPRKEIVTAGMSAAIARLPLGASRDLPRPEAFKAALASCFETHLYEGGGVMGLKEVAGGDIISASAGMEAALDLLAGSPDQKRTETALRLADFCLKGQHPSGLFYESYSLEKKAWVGASGTSRGRPVRAAARQGGPLIPLAESARIADTLLRFSEALSRMKFPGVKYRLAGERFVDHFLDDKGKLCLPGALYSPDAREPAEKGLSGMEAFFPLQRMFRLTGRDKYRKALASLTVDFLSRSWDPARPPSWREGREPDSRAALLSGRIAAEIARAGLGAPDADLFISLLAPWVHINRPARLLAVDPVGGIADSFDRQRLLFSGAETAYVLLSLAALSRSKETRALGSDLARIAMEFSTHAPIGTAFFQHTRWDQAGKDADWKRGRLGPVDSRRLAREAHYASLVYEEFPAWTRGGEVGAPAKKKTATKKKVSAGRAGTR